MLSLDTEMFMKGSDSSSRGFLHGGKVVEVDRGSYTAQFAKDVVGCEVGQEVFVYYKRDREFMQQPVTIQEVTLAEGDEYAAVAFEPTGEAISAENRQCYRVSTAVTELTARLGDEVECQLLDVSVTGFAVMATKMHGIGATVDATLYFDGKEFPGKARIQSIREMEQGRVRYGLHGLRKSEGGGELLRGMETLSAAVQRIQLRRVAGVS
jgi:hypothetical protein